MITYNDIYEAKKNSLVLFEFPQNTNDKFWRYSSPKHRGRFPIASGEIATQLLINGGIK